MKTLSEDQLVELVSCVQQLHSLGVVLTCVSTMEGGEPEQGVYRDLGGLIINTCNHAMGFLVNIENG